MTIRFGPAGLGPVKKLKMLIAFLGGKYDN
jgi:hypothetical protein